MCLRLGVVAGEEYVHGLVWSKDATEDRIERLDDVSAIGGGGDLIGRRVTRSCHKSAGVGVERVSPVDEDLARQCIAVLRNHSDVPNGEEDDLTYWRSAERADGGLAVDIVDKAIPTTVAALGACGLERVSDAATCSGDTAIGGALGDGVTRVDDFLD